MLRFVSAVAALVLLVSAPHAVLAQEQDEESSDSPAVLSISAWICPQDALQDIAENYETYTQPIEKELIDEGMLVNSGLFFHAWGDEWNLNYYRIAPTMDGLFEAVAEVGNRVDERHPELADQAGPFAVCSAHKDNIYWMPTSTARLDSDD